MSKENGMSRRSRLRLFPFLTSAASLALLLSLCSRQSATQWRTVPLEKGDLKVEVTASGTANPHSLVQVGTQVSGTIARIYVDFNSHVKNGQLIALLDTTFLRAAVQDAAATLRKTQAQATLSTRTAERTKALFDKGLAAQADLEQADADRESSKAALSSAQAQLDRAKINLAYAYIRSPITGVVINRAIDVGQTVAASFNTPTLFTIADDLTKMQVQASIDEADIGQVKIGQTSQFTVDAFPDRAFSGVVTQIRLQPTTQQNVVSYTVMIDVDNPDQVLMPGMTANLTIAVQQIHDALKVPLAALKFVPPRTSKGADSGSAWGGAKGSRQGTGGRQGDSSSVSGAQARTPSGTDSTHAWSGNGSHHGMKNGAAPDTSHSQTSMGIPVVRKKDRGRIFILENGKAVAVPVKIGLSSGGYAAVEGNIKEGQLVIVGTLSQNNKPAAPQQSPLGGGAQGGMPRRF
jgi:HlyD family secretion protein